MSEHTKGEWTAQMRPRRTSIFIIDERGKPIAEIYPRPTQAEQDANVDLFLASPALLAACKQQLATLDQRPYDFAAMLAAHRALTEAVGLVEKGSSHD